MTPHHKFSENKISSPLCKMARGRRGGSHFEAGDGREVSGRGESLFAKIHIPSTHSSVAFISLVLSTNSTIKYDSPRPPTTTLRERTWTFVIGLAGGGSGKLSAHAFKGGGECFGHSRVVLPVTENLVLLLSRHVPNSK